MPDAYGPLQHLELAPALWLVPAAPLSAFLLCFALRLIRGQRAARAVARVSIAGQLLSWAVALGYAARLLRLPASDRYLLVHLWRVVRVGQLDFGFDLALDTLSGIGVLVALGVVTASSFAVARRGGPGVLAECTWHALGLAGALLALLADGPMVLLVGWTMLAIALRALLVDERPEARVLGPGLYARAADAAMVFGATVLFWGAGGVWSEGEYVPDLTPRFSAVAEGTTSGAPAVRAPQRVLDDDDDDEQRYAAPQGKGLVTLTSYPGAIVFVDDSRTPLMKPGSQREPLRAPFVRVPLNAGHHSFRIHPGAGLDDYLVTHVPVGDGKEIHLAPFGPAAVFRQIRDPLLVHGRTFAPALASKRLWGAPVVTWASVLLLLSIALRLGAAPFGGLRARSEGQPALLVAPLGATLALYLSSRMGFLTSMSEVGSLVIASAGAVTALGGALLAAGAGEPSRRIALFGTTHLGFALLCAGARAFDALALYLVVSPLALAGLAGARRFEDGAAARASGLTLACLPVASAAAEAALRPDALASTAALALAALAISAAFVSAYAAFRLALELQETAGKRSISTVPGIASLGLLAVGGVLLRARPALIDAWLGGVLAPAPLRTGDVPFAPWAPLGLGVLLVFAAAVVARTHARQKRVPALPLSGAARALLDEAPIASVATTFVLLLQNAVSRLERWVLTPVVNAIGSGVRLVAEGHAHVESAVQRATIDAAAARLARLGAPASARRMKTIVFALLALAFAAAVTFGFMASAHAAGGALSLEVPGRSHGPLELAFKDGAYVGEMLVVNRGAEPLSVSRVSIRGDDDDLRAPTKVSARFADGAVSVANIPPGASRKVVVQWLPDREPRMKQVFCHVVVTSSDEKSGELAMGVVARIRRPVPWISDHLLSLVVFLPLLGALVAFVAHVSGRGGDALVRRVAVAVVLVQLGLALWAYAGFSADVTRSDGNDGLQLIEHVVWIRPLSAEYFIGVDGLSIMLVVLAPLLAVVAVLAAVGNERTMGFLAMLLICDTCLVGTIVAQDIILLFSFWQAAILAMAGLVGLWGGGGRAVAALKLALVLSFGSALILLAFVALRGNAERTFLVDGTSVTATSSIPELARVAFYAKKGVLFGFPFVRVVWVALFLGFGTMLPIFPFHAWLADAVESAPTSAATLLCGLMLPLGAYAILRVCFPILPEATRWASGGIVALGVVNVIYGALCAMGERDLKRIIAYLAMSHMGFCLVGLGSLTPQGIAACIAQIFAHGLATGALVVLAGVLERRVGTRDATRFGGLSREAPLFSIAFGASLLASMGAPGLAGFWGELLAILGAFPSHRGLSLVAAAGTLLVGAVHLWTFQRVLLGRFDERWRRDPHLEPFGGKIPDLTTRELTLVAPLALLLLVFGLWPTPLLGMISGGVRDVTTYVNPPGPDQIAAGAVEWGRLFVNLTPRPPLPVGRGGERSSSRSDSPLPSGRGAGGEVDGTTLPD
jgi:NADH-quinone oxidoreductase subunit M